MSGSELARASSKLVLASGNAHKREELQRALPGFALELLGSDEPGPVEDGEDYEANARLKARFARSRVGDGAWALGEDSGIEVVALGGDPGVRTARWAAGDPVGRILEVLAGEDERGARYVSLLVAISPHGRELVSRGELSGSIARDAAGSEGFGFDPVFVPVGQTRTVAELGDEWKRTWSHRAQAAGRLARLLNDPASAAPGGP